MKFLLTLSITMTTTLSMTGCSNPDWASLIEPRSGNNDKRVIQQHQRPAFKPQPQRRLVYVPPGAKRVPARISRVKPDCSYIVRDLSNPNSSTIWCHPGGSR